MFIADKYYRIEAKVEGHTGIVEVTHIELIIIKETEKLIKYHDHIGQVFPAQINKSNIGTMLEWYPGHRHFGVTQYLYMIVKGAHQVWRAKNHLINHLINLEQKIKDQASEALLKLEIVHFDIGPNPYPGELGPKDDGL